MKDTINIIAKDIAKDLLNESIIDENVISLKIKTALNALLDKNKNITGIDYVRMQHKLIKQNKQVKKLTVERDFWKDVSKIYIRDNINDYYNRLEIKLKNT